MFLLDTHVWIWHVEGNTHRVGARTARLLRRWTDQDALRISPLTVFEVAMLYTTDRVSLTRTLDQWTTTALQDGGVRLAPLTIEAALEAGRMGTGRVPDPLDRLLIATARQTDATFVTADRRILDYATTAGLRVHDARR